MDEYSNKIIICGDVYLTIKSMNKIGWKTIRESSINRILYMASVLYSFRFPSEKNIFKENYHFIITLSGPEEAAIQGALTYLEANDDISHSEDGYSIIIKNDENNYQLLPSFKEKKIWIEDMAYIIGIYGEDKIYDFIFRDPEYRTSLKSNSEYILDIGEENETIKFLNGFKGAFEENLDKGTIILDNRKYLELYFEFVFGKILRGE